MPLDDNPIVLCGDLGELNTPGVMIEVDHDVADFLGAFVEDAISEDDARASNIEGADS